MMREMTMLSMLTLLTVTTGLTFPWDEHPNPWCRDLYLSTCHRQIIGAGYCDFLTHVNEVVRRDISLAEKKRIGKNLWRQMADRLQAQVSLDCGACAFHLEEDHFQQDCFTPETQTICDFNGCRTERVRVPTASPTPVPTRDPNFVPTFEPTALIESEASQSAADLRHEICCDDYIAECLACRRGETIEELCDYQPLLKGCPVDPKGISSGTIAGIVIGAVLLLSVFLGLVYFCVIRKDNSVASPDTRPPLPSNPPSQLV